MRADTQILRRASNSSVVNQGARAGILMWSVSASNSRSSGSRSSKELAQNGASAAIRISRVTSSLGGRRALCASKEPPISADSRTLASAASRTALLPTVEVLQYGMLRHSRLLQLATDIGAQGEKQFALPFYGQRGGGPGNEHSGQLPTLGDQQWIAILHQSGGMIAELANGTDSHEVASDPIIVPCSTNCFKAWGQNNDITVVTVRRNS